MKCPACGARNAEDASWCTQCFTAFSVATSAPAGSESTSPDVAAAGLPATQDAPAPAASVPPQEDPLARTGGGDRRFRRSADGIDWSCSRCDSWNPIEVSACAVCGASFSRSLQQDAEPQQLPDIREGTALLATVALPGLGHVLAGRPVSGWLRIAFFVGWVVGGAALARAAAANGQPVTPSLPLFVGALIVWIASVVDVQSTVRTGQDTILVPRVFMWLVIGVVGLLMITFVAASLTVGGSSQS